MSTDESIDEQDPFYAHFHREPLPGAGVRMLVAMERFDLRLPGCGSLKEKRHIVKALTNQIRSTFNVSVAEVDHHDLWQRTAIAVAAVSREQYHVRKVMHEVEKFVDRWAGVETIEVELTLHYPED